MAKFGKEAFLELCADAPTELFQRGDILMRQGETGKDCFVIQEGTVGISAMSLGGRVVAFPDCGKGDLVGELSLFQKSRAATVVAKTACQCSRIPLAVLMQLVATKPAIAIALLAVTMEKARALRD